MRTMAWIGGLFLCAAGAAAQDSQVLFVPAMPPKPGLWEHSYQLSAKAPETDTAAELPKEATHHLFVSNSQVDTTPTTAVEQVCWTKAMIDKAQWKVDLSAALRQMSEAALCTEQAPSRTETALRCNLGDGYLSKHSYDRKPVDNDTFTVTEYFEVTRAGDEAEPVMMHRIHLIAHRLSPTCKPQKKH